MMKAKTVKKEAFLNGDTLIIDGKPYSVNNLNALPAGLSPIKVATPTIGDTIIAFLFFYLFKSFFFIINI